MTTWVLHRRHLGPTPGLYPNRGLPHLQPASLRYFTALRSVIRRSNLSVTPDYHDLVVNPVYVMAIGYSLADRCVDDATRAIHHALGAGHLLQPVHVERAGHDDTMCQRVPIKKQALPAK